MKELFIAIFSVFVEYGSRAGHFCKRNFHMLAVFIQIGFPVFLLYYKIDMWNALFLSLCLYVLTAFIKDVSRKVNKIHDNDIPIPERRYTYNKNGHIGIYEILEADAISYLYELEELFDSKGWLNK